MVVFDDITDLQTVATDHNPYWVSMCTIDQGIKHRNQHTSVLGFAKVSLFAKLAYWFFPQYGMEIGLILILDQVDLDGNPLLKLKQQQTYDFVNIKNNV